MSTWQGQGRAGRKAKGSGPYRSAHISGVLYRLVGVDLQNGLFVDDFLVVEVSVAIDA